MTSNEIIAKFMGLECRRIGDDEYEEFEWLPRFVHSNWCFKTPPPFDTSWDWLMPVVEKINNKYQLWCQTKRFKEMDPIYRKLQNELIFCSINGVHEWCVKFIKWYSTDGDTKHE